MSTRTRLYNAFGEMLYVVAMSDGIIQPEEEDVLHRILAKHPFGEDIQWSFDYEQMHISDIESLYQKVLNICHDNGPDPEYQMLINVMEEVAKASSGVDDSEKKMIDRFIFELTDRFKNDIEKLK